MSNPQEQTGPEVEYFFSFISLWSYVGSLKFQDIVKRHGVKVVYKPIDLMAIFTAGGGKPVKERPLPRQAYRLVEMERWRRFHGIPLVLHPRYYPVDPSLAHRVLLLALTEGRDTGAFVHAGLKAVWADELNIEDPQTIAHLANQSGLDGDRLLAAANDPVLIEREKTLTAEAINRQIFGAPFYIYQNEPFWGQDRLDHLEETIAGKLAPLVWPSLTRKD